VAGSISRRALPVVAAVLLAVLALAPGSAVAKSTAAYLAEDRALVNTEAALEGAKLGVALPSPAAGFIQVKQSGLRAFPVKGRADGVNEAAAQTLCYWAVTGPIAYCDIDFSLDPHQHGELSAVVAHEVFHVYEAVMAGSLANYNRETRESDWMVEGGSVWVESELHFGARLAAGERGFYYRTPAKGLFARTYDAVGFFDNMKANGLSPWSRMKSMFAATSNQGSYAAALGAGEDAFLKTQASVYFLDHGAGFPWEPPPNEPLDAGARYPIGTVSPASAEPAPVKAPAYAVAVRKLSLAGMSKSRPLLELVVERGTVRLRSSTGAAFDRVVEGDLTLCSATKRDCTCPGSSGEDFPIFHRGELALSGAGAGGEVRLRVRKPCQPPLGQRSCAGLLSGFSSAPGDALERAVKEPFSVITTARPAEGFYSYTCAFQAKGTVLKRTVSKQAVENGEPMAYTEQEEYFHGVLIPLMNLTRFANVAAAEKILSVELGIYARLGLHRVPIGEFAEEGTKNEVNGSGETEYSSFAIIRVRNVVIYFSLVGDEEANEYGTRLLMAQAAAGA
jgi:hypothetical protein